MKTGYFSENYYTIEQLADKLEVHRSRVEAAMKYIQFPVPAMRVGKAKMWKKETVEPLLPQLILFMTEGTINRRRTKLVQQIKLFIKDKELEEQEVYELECDFQSEYGVKSNTIRHYGGWISLVSKAFRVHLMISTLTSLIDTL
jgi:hypothetical protein